MKKESRYRFFFSERHKGSHAITIDSLSVDLVFTENHPIIYFISLDTSSTLVKGRYFLKKFLYNGDS